MGSLSEPASTLAYTCPPTSAYARLRRRVYRTGALATHRLVSQMSVPKKRARDKQPAQGGHQTLRQRAQPPGQRRNPHPESQRGDGPDRPSSVNPPGNCQGDGRQYGREGQKPRLPRMGGRKKRKGRSKNRHRKAVHGADGRKDSQPTGGSALGQSDRRLDVFPDRSCFHVSDPRESHPHSGVITCHTLMMPKR